MKKSIIAIGIGAFVGITALLCMNPDGKMYQKQKHFDSVNDVLTQLENNKIIEIDTDREQRETKEFQECLSKRKRLTFSQINFQKVKIEKIEELDQKQKDSLIEDYNKLQERLSVTNKPTKIEPVRLVVKGKFPIWGGDPYEEENSDAYKEDFIVDFIMIDEGEGMVIDYYVQHSMEETKDKEGEVNVKG